MNLGNRVLISAFWATASRWSVRLISVVSTVILARILVPNDFGVVASASLVVNLLTIMSETGMGSYLIRIKDADKYHYNTAWTINLLTRSCIGIAIYLGAHQLSVFYNDYRLEAAWQVMALVVFVSGFINIGLIKVKKELQHHKIFIHETTTKVFGFVSTLYLSYLYRNYWGMIYGSLATGMVEVIVSFMVSSYRPTICFRGFKDQWHFSKWIFLTNISGFIRQKLDQMLVSKTLGVQLMGYYSMASDISSLPSEFIYPTMGPIYSGYSDLLDRETELHNSFITVIGVISTLSFPMYLGLIYMSDAVVALFLGPKWLVISDLIQAMSLVVLLQILCFSFTGFLTAKGQVKLLTTLDWLFILILLPALLFAATYGSAVLIVWGRIVPYIILALALFIVTCSGSSGMAGRMISVAIRPILAALLMNIFLNYIKPFISNLNPNLDIAINIVSGAIVYALSLICFWIITGRKEGGERFILAKLGLILKRNLR